MIQIFKNSRTKLLIYSLISAVSLSAFSDQGLVIENPWIREAPPNSPTLAGYMLIKNESGKPQSLVGATSKAFGKVMIHRTEQEEGMAKMVHQKKVTLAPNSRLTFKPGGYHLMLMKPAKPLKVGDKVSIDLIWENGAKQPVTYMVKKHMGADKHQPTPSKPGSKSHNH